MIFIHEFTFEVGEAEKHTVHFRYEKYGGKVTVTVDGFEVYKDRILTVFEAFPKKFMIQVGTKEVHQVVFDFEPGFPFFVRPKIKAYVDTKLVATY